MADVRLRRVGEEDWQSLRNVRLAALADSPDSFGSTYERERAYSDDDWRGWARDAAGGGAETCVLAWDGDEAVAMVGAYVEDDSAHAHLIAMWVAPRARRRGLGEMLVAAIVAWAAETGSDAVRLDVLEDNTEAKRLYERCGFVSTGRSRPYDDRPHLVTVELERTPQ